MKNLLNILLLLSLFATSTCNKEEPTPRFKPLPIHNQFKTQTRAVKLSELKDFLDYKDHIFVVNSLNELPDDIHFGTSDFKDADIDFAHYSLIIAYQLCLGEIVSSKYLWGYNTPLSSYEVNLTCDCVKDSKYQDGEIENFTYIRLSFLADKIPTNSNCTLSSQTHAI